MVDYRPFHNSDPPEVRRLWHDCGLGRGAATDFDADVLETTVFAQPYFDRAGLILAIDDGGLPVGFVHAGFGAMPMGDALDRRVGVICVVMVAPSHRRRGIGRELIARAEQYLSERGAETIFAGAGAPHDPFYAGLYGGSEAAGWLESDPLADPFITRLGYQPLSRTLVLQRSLVDKGDPIGLRLMGVRRTTRITPVAGMRRSWWWSTRAGRLDTLDFELQLKSGGTAVASVTVAGLDFYIPRWQQRGIGFLDLQVPEALRKKGYGQALLVEICRKLRDELITVAEAHVPAGDAAALNVFESAGFRIIDAGQVYRRP